MANSAPAQDIRKLELHISSTLRQTDLGELSQPLKMLLAKMWTDLETARIHAQAYELSEMRDEQLQNAKVARKWLSAVRRAILKASEDNVFSTIDVAHLTAQIDILKSELK